MTSPNTTYSVSVLLQKDKDGELWVAQGLEYDIAAQGQNASDARNRFLHAFEGHIALDIEENREPLSEVPQAPRRYFMKAYGFHQTSVLPVYVPAKGAKRPTINAKAAFFEASGLSA